MSNRTINFTKAALDSLPIPAQGKRVTYHDSKTDGLQIRVTSSGVKTFNVFRWVSVDGKPERVTLGRYPHMSIEKAREKAQVINAAIAEKKNPNEVIRAGKAEITLRELFDIYMERWSKPRKRTWNEDEEKFKRYCETRSNLASKKLSRITKVDIAHLHSRIGKEHPTTANRVLALISSIFGRAAEWGMWDNPNPAQGIRKFPEKSRDRFIQSDELPVFFEAMAQEQNELLQDYFMLLLLTGVRRSNLMAMRWDEISFERKEWRIPETKNGTPQVISLDDGHGVIMRILENRKAKIKEYKARAEGDDATENEAKLAKMASKWVFPSTSDTGHIVEPRKGWERILARAEVYQLISIIADAEKWTAEKMQQAKQDTHHGFEKAILEYRKRAEKLKLEINSVGLSDLRIHDLRRTLGSWMAGTGASTVIIGRQLNHKSPSATAVYSRLQLDPVTAARNKAVSAIFGAAGMTPTAQVVPFRGAK